MFLKARIQSWQAHAVEVELCCVLLSLQTLVTLEKLEAQHVQKGYPSLLSPSISSGLLLWKGLTPVRGQLPRKVDACAKPRAKVWVPQSYRESQFQEKCGSGLDSQCARRSSTRADEQLQIPWESYPLESSRISRSVGMLLTSYVIFSKVLPVSMPQFPHP